MHELLSFVNVFVPVRPLDNNLSSCLMQFDQWQLWSRRRCYMSRICWSNVYEQWVSHHQVYTAHIFTTFCHKVCLFSCDVLFCHAAVVTCHWEGRLFRVKSPMRQVGLVNEILHQNIVPRKQNQTEKSNSKPYISPKENERSTKPLHGNVYVDSIFTAQVVHLIWSFSVIRIECRQQNILHY